MAIGAHILSAGRSLKDAWLPAALIVTVASAYTLYRSDGDRRFFRTRVTAALEAERVSLSRSWEKLMEVDGQLRAASASAEAAPLPEAAGLSPAQSQVELLEDRLAYAFLTLMLFASSTRCRELFARVPLLAWMRERMPATDGAASAAVDGPGGGARSDPDGPSCSSEGGRPALPPAALLLRLPLSPLPVRSEGRVVPWLPVLSMRVYMAIMSAALCYSLEGDEARSAALSQAGVVPPMAAILADPAEAPFRKCFYVSALGELRGLRAELALLPELGRPEVRAGLLQPLQHGHRWTKESYVWLMTLAVLRTGEAGQRAIVRELLATMAEPELADGAQNALSGNQASVAILRQGGTASVASKAAAAEVLSAVAGKAELSAPVAEEAVWALLGLLGSALCPKAGPLSTEPLADFGKRKARRPALVSGLLLLLRQAEEELAAPGGAGSRSPAAADVPDAKTTAGGTRELPGPSRRPQALALQSQAAFALQKLAGRPGTKADMHDGGCLPPLVELLRVSCQRYLSSC